MFETLFGWRKASTCKKLIRHVQCRLKILKNKRETIIRQVKDDVVQLVKKGHEHSAFSRVEQLIRDQNTRDAYNLLDNFGEFIIIQMPYIRKHKDCPIDINEAVSSLLFASGRFGDLPELEKLRKLFGKRYGKTFAITAVELHPGNLVNQQVIDKVCMKSISDDVKFRLLKEIARDNNLQLRPPDIEDCKLLLEYHQVDNHSSRKLELDTQEVACDDIGGPPFQLSNYKRVQELNPDIYSCRGTPMRPQKESQTTMENPYQICERPILFLDDIEEFRPSVKEDDYEGDRRSFRFVLTSPYLRNNNGGNRESSLHSYFDSDNRDDCTTHGISTGKCLIGATKMKKSFKKKFDGRYVSNKKDMEDAYGHGGDPWSCSRHYVQRNNRYKISPQNSHSSPVNCFRKELVSYYPKEEIFCEAVASLKCKYDWINMWRSRDLDHNIASDCSLQHPCYIFSSFDDVYSGIPSPSPSSWTWTRRYIEFTPQNFQQGERTRHLCAANNAMSETRRKEIEVDLSCNLYVGFASSCGSCGSTPPAGNQSDALVIIEQSNHRHVHPKLPDYDDLVTKFRALKIEYMQRSLDDATNDNGRS